MIKSLKFLRKTMNNTNGTMFHLGLKIPLLRTVKNVQKNVAHHNRCLHTNFYFKECIKSVNLKRCIISAKNIARYRQSRFYCNVNEITLTDKQVNNEVETDMADEILTNLKLQRERRYKNLQKGPGLSHFVHSRQNYNSRTTNIPYIQSINGNNQKVYLEIFGCQMNVNDAEVISAILKKNGYLLTKTLDKADIILIVTCSIRDSAEEKIWNKLNFYQGLKKRNRISKVGILGCMAERLKHKIIEKDKCVDIVAGPDSYRDLPRLLAKCNEHEAAINVALSMDETYADITPVRLNPDSKTAYVTIMRGCDNMCTYCVVPFTRGKERSRPISSIVDEIKKLSDEGIKEVTLLGQNVNSYRDLSETTFCVKNETNLAKGFKTVYKNKMGGLRFSDLLDKVSLINPEMRIRFTSPHPKDFPDEVLYLIYERSNICKQIHLPAQSGSTAVLERMRRGYSREAYLELVNHIRSIIPNIALSSDFIVGFCDETEEEFQETLTLLEEVKYSTAYLFAYSMREKTTAYRRYTDNIDKKIKLERLQKLIKLYRSEVDSLFKSQIGSQQLVLVEGESKRSPNELVGRNDANIKVILSNESIPEVSLSSLSKPIESGDYVLAHIYYATSQTLRGIPLYHSTISEYNSQNRLNVTINSRNQSF